MNKQGVWVFREENLVYVQKGAGLFSIIPYLLMRYAQVGNSGVSFTLNMALMALWSDSQDLPTLAALSY